MCGRKAGKSKIACCSDNLLPPTCSAHSHHTHDVRCRHRLYRWRIRQASHLRRTHVPCRHEKVCVGEIFRHLHTGLVVTDTASDAGDTEDSEKLVVADVVAAGQAAYGLVAEQYFEYIAVAAELVAQRQGPSPFLLLLVPDWVEEAELIHVDLSWLSFS